MSFVLYGATGYTGALIAEASAARGLRPTLAGRSEAPLRALGERLGLPHVVVALDDQAGLDRLLDTAPLVLHCAGPYAETARPMVDACLRTGRHYLDLTGEIPVFEALRARDDEARARGVLLLPGVGFDVVPSDCLALHVARRLPDASALELCVASFGSASHGTAATALSQFRGQSAERAGGRLVATRFGSRRRAFDLGDGKEHLAVGAPLADVVTAAVSTGIADVRAYLVVAGKLRRALRLAPIFGPLLGVGPIARALRASLPPGGPSAEARARGRTVVVAEASNGTGGRASARLTGPDAYALTVDCALLCVARVLAGHAPPGFQTPARAFGPDLVLEAPGVQRVDLPT
ncbi:MAG: saccharopine dehydrogenase NADP-binding domain-containing protein [Deltaproteobacteria bacterium]|nr:saccharopine dehydrogenase NADP-binding domain-containing protein [Deltaproteobacteria bacterium]